MANQEQLDLLKQGVETWNQWRENNPGLEINLSKANLSKADLSHINLYGANLSYVNLCYADLSHADLSNTNLYNADLIDAHLIGTHLSYADLTYANLYGAYLNEANLSYVNLVGANLSRVNLMGAKLITADLNSAKLIGAKLIGANLSHADLIGANLANADLKNALALDTNLNAAILTGACIEDWHINSHTNLQGIVCEYIFNKYDYQKWRYTDRLPHDPNQIFAPGEFTKRYQTVLETVELFFNDGIDWKAFLASLQDLKTQYGDDLNIQGIEKKAGGSFVVRVEVPSGTDKGIFERDVKALYETNLQILEAKYHAELQAKDKEIESYKRENANMTVIAQLLASRPITVENEVVVEQSNSETYNTNIHGNVGNFANKMQDQASQQTNQYIGANLNEITALIHSLRGKAESFPEAQKTEAIDHLTDLETDIQQPPEKRKPHRIKATLLALVAVATAISGAVTHTNEFVGQLQELADKLNIPLPIEQVEPESEKQDAIDVKAIDPD